MNFYEPTIEAIERMSGEWCASFSGGKDSTSVVTWIEYLRRSGQIECPNPMLVRSDTGVEEQNLVAVAEELTEVLEASGWECHVVQPLMHERLYTQILGRGLPPIHPGIRRMRWCTRSTKIDPMKRQRPDALCVTGLRLGESKMREGKILGSCAAGGECGIPVPSETTYSPILNWRTCHVIDWLNGMVGRDVRDHMGDVFAVTKKLAAVYNFRVGQSSFDFADADIRAARFGCIGCPAIGSEAYAPASVVRRYGNDSPLNELYGVWHEARKPANRLIGFRNGKQIMGPIRLAVRPRLLADVKDIQYRASVELVTPNDEIYIRDCWARKVYPRGWSEADEVVSAPAVSLPLWGESL